jgi:hypothetical protein
VTEPAGVYGAIAQAIEDCAEGVRKDKTAGSGNFAYKFRGIDAFLGHMNPILAKNGLMIVLHETTEATQHQRVTVKKSGNTEYETIQYCTQEKQTWRVYHKDGSFVQTQLFIENANGQDKGPNACISVGWKYVAITVFAIPVDDASVEDETKDVTETRAPARQAPSQQRQAPPPRYSQDRANLGPDNEPVNDSKPRQQRSAPPPPPPAQQRNSAPPPAIDYKSVDLSIVADGWARRVDGGMHEGKKLVELNDRVLSAFLKACENAQSHTPEAEVDKRAMYAGYIVRVMQILDARKLARQKAPKTDPGDLPEDWGGPAEREPGQEG